MTSSPALRRRLTLPQALAIGVGSMVGAGIFSILGPAAAQAGPWLLPALALAGLTAWANATSTAQLAAVHPTSGGAYTFGRRQLNDWAGFIAGWGFVAGKCASVAAMAFTFALYLVPGTGSESSARWVAIAAVVVLTAINLLGITRTAQATVAIVIPVVAILALVIVAGFVCGGAAVLRLRRVCARRHARRGGDRPAAVDSPRHARRAGVHTRALCALGGGVAERAGACAGLAGVDAEPGGRDLADRAGSTCWAWRSVCCWPSRCRRCRC